MTGRAQPGRESGHQRRRCQPQRGQAATELIVVCAALLPMFFLFPLLGKYLDMFHTAEVASRYVAFEATVHPPGSPQHKSDAALSTEVAQRFFSQPQAPIRTGEAPVNDAAHRLPLWKDHKGTPLMQDYAQDVKVVTQTEGFNFHALTRSIWHEGMGLPENNLLTASVTIKPRNLPGVLPFDGINLSTTRHTGMLVDTWATQGPAQVKDRVENLRSLYPMEALDGPLKFIGQLPKILGEKAFKFGMPDEAWDLLPCDRVLKKGQTQPQCP